MLEAARARRAVAMMEADDPSSSTGAYTCPITDHYGMQPASRFSGDAILRAWLWADISVTRSAASNERDRAHRTTGSRL